MVVHAAASTTPPGVGIALGVLIGVLTGAVAIALFQAAWNESDRTGILKVTGEILAIPTFWFGGPWLTTTMFASVGLDEIRSPYLISLAIVFAPIAGFIVVMKAWKVGRDIASQPSPASGGGANA
jgi:hypothetical protein